MNEYFDAVAANGKADHRKNNEGVDCTRMYLTYADLTKLGIPRAVAIKAMKVGDLKCARPGKGQLRALFLPEDVLAYAIDRADRLTGVKLPARWRAVCEKILAKFITRAVQCSSN